MAQSLNTKVDLTTDALSYLGFSQYGKVMIGDTAFEFFNERNVESNMQFPWKSIERVEGNISKSFRGHATVGRHFSIVLHNGKKIHFSSKDAGKILKFAREYLGNDKVVKAPRFHFSNFKNVFKRRPKKEK